MIRAEYAEIQRAEADYAAAAVETAAAWAAFVAPIGDTGRAAMIRLGDAYDRAATMRDAARSYLLILRRRAGRSGRAAALV